MLFLTPINIFKEYQKILSQQIKYNVDREKNLKFGGERIFVCKLHFYTRMCSKGSQKLPNLYGSTLQWIVLGLGKNFRYLVGGYPPTLNKKDPHPKKRRIF